VGKKPQYVPLTRRHRLVAAFLALSFFTVLCAGSAQTLDVLLTKQVGEPGGESGVSDLGALIALHTPGIDVFLSLPQPLWLLVPSTVHLPSEPTTPSNYVRPPPFAS
jgi:hypothetical protein